MVERNRRAVILMADDDPVNLRILSRHLRDMGTIATCGNGAEAIECALADPPDLILLDVSMPIMDGYEACRKFKSLPQTKNVPIIFITGQNDEKSEAAAFSLGAVDFVAKPIKPAVVRARVGTHLELKRLRDGLEAQVEERTSELRDTQREILHRLAMAAEYRDRDTGAHINRIREFAALLCAACCAEECRRVDIPSASILHDVGKIGVPDGILFKPGRLTTDEFEIMKRHTTIGGQLLANLAPPLLRTARDIALCHHEKWDGSGYPAGLAGEAIPLAGRIVALCDVFDALTSERPYKRAWTAEASFREISRGRGKHFDPALTDLFLSMKEEILRVRARHADPEPEFDGEHDETMPDGESARSGTYGTENESAAPILPVATQGTRRQEPYREREEAVQATTRRSACDVKTNPSETAFFVGGKHFGSQDVASSGDAIDWNGLPLFDQEDGLGRTGGDTAFFGEMLEIFLEAHSDDPVRLRQAADRLRSETTPPGNADAEETTRILRATIMTAHAVKGSSGNLGLRRLTEKARWAEKRLKNSLTAREEDVSMAPDVPASLPDMLESLAATLSETLSFAREQHVRFREMPPRHS